MIYLTSKGVATGIARISGLPTVQNQYIGLFNLGYYGNMAGLTSPAGYISGGTSTIVLVNRGAAAHVNMTDANFTDTSAFFFGGTYISQT